jgi:3-dehydroquinate synthetase
MTEKIGEALIHLGLPVEIPGNLPRGVITEAMQLDKKKSAGLIRFALPQCVGSVQTGVIIEGWKEKIFLPDQ